ncbi:MAG: hypothetical protein HKO56_08100, partial [Bacteroidia bacterium]|nr:hypothetical protein [Bacteroidia bacterium]
GLIGANVTAIPTGAATYIVQAVQGACVATDTITITFGSLPIVSVSADNDTICAGDSTNLNLSVVISGAGGELELNTADFTGLTFGNPNGTAIYGGWNTPSGAATPDWNIDNNTTGSFATGPNGGADPTGVPTNGNPYVYLETSVGGGTFDRYLESPALDFSSVGNASIEFWYHMYGAQIGTLSVETSADGGTTWVPTTFSLSGQQQTSEGDNWLPAVVDISSLAGNPAGLVRFHAVHSAGCCSGDMALDNFRVFGTPAGFAWTPGGSLSDSTTASPVAAPTTTTTYTVTVTTNEGCTATSSVTVNVVPVPAAPVCMGDTICGEQTATLTATGSGSGTLNWYGVPAGFPGVENFEAGDGGFISGGTNSTWAFGSAGSFGASSGTNAWQNASAGTYNNNEASWVESPVIYDFSAAVAPIVQLDVAYNTEFSWDGAQLQSSINGGTSWQTVGSTASGGTNWYNDNTITGLGAFGSNGWSGNFPTYVTASHDVSSLVGNSDVRFRVFFGSDGSVNGFTGFAFDDFQVIESGGDLVLLGSGNSFTTDVITETTTFLVSEDNGYCVGPADTCVVVFIEADSIIATATPGVICQGDTVLLEPFSANASYTYTWSGPNVLGTTVTGSATAMPSSDATYTVVGTDGFCTSETEISVLVNPKPILSITPGTSLICAGDST